MPVLKSTRKEVLVDEDGYLVHSQDWDEEVARMLALREGLPALSEDGVAILRFIRFYYDTYDFFPIVRSICKNVHEQKDCVYQHFVTPLTAWKIAGLPHPQEPMISLLEAGQSPG